MEEIKKKCISSVHSSFKTISTTHLAQGPLKHTILSTDIVFTTKKGRKNPTENAVQLLGRLVAVT